MFILNLNIIHITCNKQVIHVILITANKHVFVYEYVNLKAKEKLSAIFWERQEKQDKKNYEILLSVENNQPKQHNTCNANIKM
jgi:hypothetical protein